MKKLLAVAGLVLSLSALTGCEGMITNWHGRNMVREAEFEAQRMQIDAEALLYYQELQAQSILLRAQAEAEAEVIRASGIAEAMEIINANITEDYLKHLFIRTLAENGNVIYIPTEVGFPAFLTQGIEMTTDTD